jgi:hypothetical protein
MLNAIQPASGDDFRKTALFPILQMFDGEAVVVSRSDGPTAFVWKLDKGMVGVISEEDSLIVTIATSDSVHSTGLEDSAFDSFISKLQQTIGALNIRFAYKNGSSLNFSRGRQFFNRLKSQPLGTMAVRLCCRNVRSLKMLPFLFFLRWI